MSYIDILKRDVKQICNKHNIPTTIKIESEADSDADNKNRN